MPEPQQSFIGRREKALLEKQRSGSGSGSGSEAMEAGCSKVEEEEKSALPEQTKGRDRVVDHHGPAGAARATTVQALSFVSRMLCKQAALYLSNPLSTLVHEPVACLFPALVPAALARPTLTHLTLQTAFQSKCLLRGRLTCWVL